MERLSLVIAEQVLPSSARQVAEVKKKIGNGLIGNASRFFELSICTLVDAIQLVFLKEKYFKKSDNIRLEAKPLPFLVNPCSNARPKFRTVSVEKRFTTW